jgi:hypothetical protein
MEVFELDPTPWHRWWRYKVAKDVLQSVLYFAAIERDLCIAIVEPAPPAMHEGLWRDQVRDFLVNQLNRQVLDYQPSLFGIGSVAQILVMH